MKWVSWSGNPCWPCGLFWPLSFWQPYSWNEWVVLSFQFEPRFRKPLNLSPTRWSLTDSVFDQPALKKNIWAKKEEPKQTWTVLDWPQRYRTNVFFFKFKTRKREREKEEGEEEKERKLKISVEWTTINLATAVTDLFFHFKAAAAAAINWQSCSPAFDSHI